MLKVGVKVVVPFWLGLGFYRGVVAYNYEYKCNCIAYNKPIYLYSRCFGSGVFGVFIYANPFFIPSVIDKELYRIEVNLRKLDEEKEKPNFYRLIN